MRLCIIARIAVFGILWFLSCKNAVEAPQTTIDMKPFITNAKQALCARDVNKLFAIDDSMVFYQIEDWGCNDWAYRYHLYGTMPSIMFCSLEDNIRGSQEIIYDSTYLEIFHTITSNVNKKDLGLGAFHTVIQVKFDDPQTIDINSFIAMAENAACADSLNKLFTVDDTLVFWQREGSCPDSLHHLYLLFNDDTSFFYCKAYGNDTRMMVMWNPRFDYAVPTFQIIIYNVKNENLGLSPEHKVERIIF